jgi:LacI family transcriptional regulator
VSTCVERTHGFVERFLSSGTSVPDSCIQTSTPDGEGGYEAAHALLERHPEITAIFAINDFAAIGAMGAAREHGRVVGKNFAVGGYNDIPLARWLPVPLTSVSSPWPRWVETEPVPCTPSSPGRRSARHCWNRRSARNSTTSVRLS